jgi:hypothetical protein
VGSLKGLILFPRFDLLATSVVPGRTCRHVLGGGKYGTRKTMIPIKFRKLEGPYSLFTVRESQIILVYIYSICTYNEHDTNDDKMTIDKIGLDKPLASRLSVM